MKKSAFILIGLTVLGAFILSSGSLFAQPMTGYGMGSVSQNI